MSMGTFIGNSDPKNPSTKGKGAFPPQVGQTAKLLNQTTGKMSPLRKGYENGPQPIHPPPAPPLKREGRGALIHDNMIYRNLHDQRYAPPCGQGGWGWVDPR